MTRGEKIIQQMDEAREKDGCAAALAMITDCRRCVYRHMLPTGAWECDVMKDFSKTCRDGNYEWAMQEVEE